MSKSKQELLDTQEAAAEAAQEEAEIDEVMPTVIPQGAMPVEPVLPPKQAMLQAKEKASVLMEAVEEAGLSYDLGGTKKHLGIQAWQILGKFDNATPRLVWTKRMLNDDNTFYGYEAKVEVYKNGQVIASADAMCTRDEDNWNTRGNKLVPEFQLRSMSETRAASKALRFAYGWIAVLAGYSDTPKEEMTGNEHVKKTPAKKPTKTATAQAAQGAQLCKKCGSVLKYDKRGQYAGYFCPKAPKNDRTHSVVWENK